jgi:NTE family protein
MGRRFPLDRQDTSAAASRPRRLFNVIGPSSHPQLPAPPSIVDTMPGAIDVMQERIAQARLVTEPPEVVIAPRLGQLGPFEYHRAALAIAEGREAVAHWLPAIHEALAV